MWSTKRGLLLALLVVVCLVSLVHAGPSNDDMPHPGESYETSMKDAKSLGVKSTNFIPLLSDRGSSALIMISATLGFAFAMYWWYVLSDIVLSQHRNEGMRNAYLSDEVMRNVYIIYHRISDGATAFLFSEYKYMGVFMMGFGVLLFMLLGLANGDTGIEATAGASGMTSAAADLGKAAATLHSTKSGSPWTSAGFSLMAFFLGAITSVGAGWIGMRIAVYTNARTAVMATSGSEEGDQAEGFAYGFQTAFRGGITMGFGLTSMGLFSLYLTVKAIGAYFGDSHNKALYECVAAFGLGGSAIACFGRVGGGIYTKAADVGADLVGKVEKNIPEDDPRNPGVIADCIGDNVGDIAGMGSDLFGSFGEASCAALVIAAGSAELASSFTAMMYPLLITATGILVCIVVASIGATTKSVRRASDIEPTLKFQLLLSTVLATIALIVLSFIALPSHFVVHDVEATRWGAMGCVLAGLWSGLLIGYSTEYYTSNSYRPVQEVAEACETGAATNIIYGLSLGYVSVVPPIIAMFCTIYISYRLCSLYGFALAALGILSTMSIALTIDAYGPISDNAGGIAEMSHMGPEIREITDALDAAGNTTAAIGKGFAIASAAFVALALYGAYISRVSIPVVNILDAHVMPGLLLGAMLPYWFSAMTMKSVGLAAMEMVEEIRRQFRDPDVAEGRVEPDYHSCVAIATEAALREMIAPAVLVMLSPILVGILLGKYTLAGLLPGAIVSGVQMAISASNTGGAWDNAKKYIEQGGLGNKNKGKGSPQHAAAVIGDTVGDPLKDTSGPALNILIKLMAIISVVFAPVFQSRMGGLLLHLVE